MKRIPHGWLFLIMAFIFIFSCANPITEKIIVEKYGMQFNGPVKEIQIFPNESMNVSRAVVTIDPFPGYGIDPTTDFNAGIMCRENSYPSNGTIHQIDVSSIVGKQASQVFLYVDKLDGRNDYSFEAKFRPHGMNVQWLSAYYNYWNQESTLISALTDQNGIIDWYHTYQGRYDDYFVGDDGFVYHNYGAIKIRIVMVYYTNLIVIPQQ